ICLASMLPASRFGTIRMSGWPATAEAMPLVIAETALIALSNASGPSSTPPLIWPRSAILHSTAASSVDGMAVVTVSTADRIATFGLAIPPTVVVQPRNDLRNVRFFDSMPASAVERDGIRWTKRRLGDLAINGGRRLEPRC